MWCLACYCALSLNPINSDLSPLGLILAAQQVVFELILFGRGFAMISVFSLNPVVDGAFKKTELMVGIPPLEGEHTNIWIYTLRGRMLEIQVSDETLYWLRMG